MPERSEAACGRWNIVVVLLAAIAVAIAGCAADEVASVDGLIVPEGFTVSEVVTGLDGPTQVTTVNDAWLVLAELNGGESDGTGRIVAIPDRDQPAETTVLFDDLLKPTGVAVVGDEVWVMEERTLSRGPIGGGDLAPVLEDLPYNGRSETTLTVTERGTLLYGTTGRLIDGVPQDGSGTLWELDPSTEISTALSRGFKNPYAHVAAGDRPWVTEMSDGSFDGEPAPDELVRVSPGVDHGWPACIGDRVAVTEFGGTEVDCEGGPPSHALFDPGATPTSVAIAPWDANVLLVALWRENRVVSVPLAEAGAPHDPVTFMSGEFTPQHLLADGDRLLVVDFDGGRILAVEPV
ncbi:MAG: glucose sorbosone dehydrogenase [Actinomycetota bacterium]